MGVKREQVRGKLFTRRALLLGGGQAALLATVAGRLYYLQIVEAGRFVTLADENRISIRLIAPPRGLILDRFGVALAANRPTYRAVLVPDQSGAIDATLDAVSSLVPLSDADRRRVAHDVRAKHGFVPVVIRENMSWQEMARIEVNTLDLAGVSVEEGLARDYPFGETVSHVVGYVAAVSWRRISPTTTHCSSLPDFRIGKSGIEKGFDIELRGTAAGDQPGRGQRVRPGGARARGTRGRHGRCQEIALGIDMACWQ